MSSLDNIQKVLAKKFIQNKIGHFLLVNSKEISSQDLAKWCFEIINEYFFNIHQKTISIENNPDILFIKDENYLQKKFYDKSFLNDIAQFTSHKALTGEKKFILIENLKYMSENHMNKLLKTLEEPPVPMHILILNSDNVRPLLTISSRSISIQCPLKTKGEEKNQSKLLNKFNDYPMHRFIEECKKTQDAEKNLAKYVLDNAHSISNINLIESINNYLKSQSHDYEYNYSPNYRLIQLYNAFQILKQQ
jgi:DNA polymerase III delta prime subunit